MNGSDDGIVELKHAFDNHSEFLREHLEEQKSRQEIQRAENIHILVALGVLSAFVALSTTREVALPTLTCVFYSNELTCILFFHALLSLLFIPLKLATITVLPFYSPKWVRNIDHKYLPMLHVFIFMGSLPALVILAAGYNPTHPYLVLGYFAIEGIVLIIPAVIYGLKFQKKVSDLNTTATDREVIVAGSGSGDAAELHVENPTEDRIAKDEIRFTVDSPPGLTVRIGQCTPTNDSETEFKPKTGLEPGEPSILPVEIWREDTSPGISQSEIRITTTVDGEKMGEDTIKTRY